MDQQSTLFVDQYYMMQPQFEDLLEAADLRNGMIVLCENPMWRRNMRDAVENGGYVMRAALENNRWCEVTNLRPETRTEYSEETGEVTRIFQVITFIGLYGDGTKIKRVVGPTTTWLVKLDSYLT